MSEWKIKGAVEPEEQKTAQQEEQTVLDQAVEKGDITPEAAGQETEDIPKINLNDLKEDQETEVKENDTPVEETEEGNEEKLVSVPANDDFFLDYSMEEYLKFASRTDVEGPPILEQSEESGEEENEEEAGESKVDGDEEEDADKDDNNDMSEISLHIIWSIWSIYSK